MDKNKQGQTDPMLDVPAEANTEKHINFLKEEEENANEDRSDTNASNKRREQWQKGLEEGKEAEEESKRRSGNEE